MSEITEPITTTLIQPDVITTSLSVGQGPSGTSLSPIPASTLLANATGSTALPTAIDAATARALLSVSTTAQTQTLLDGKLNLTGGTLSGLLSFTGTTHAGIRLNSLTTAQYNGITPGNGDLFYDTTTNRVSARTSGVTSTLLDTRGGQTVSGGIVVEGSITSGKTGSVGSISICRDSNGLAIGIWKVLPGQNTVVFDNTAGDMSLQRGSVERLRLTATGITLGGTLILGDSAGPQLRNNAGVIEARNNANTAMAVVSAANLIVPTGGSITSGGAGTGSFFINNDGNSRWNFNNDNFLVTGNVQPTSNNTRALGTTVLRWSNVFSTLGNFSGLVTIGPSVTGTATALQLQNNQGSSGDIVSLSMSCGGGTGGLLNYERQTTVSGDFVFYTSAAFSGSLTERLRIAAGGAISALGNLGIGVATPATKLDVRHTATNMVRLVNTTVTAAAGVGARIDSLHLSDYLCGIEMGFIGGTAIANRSIAFYVAGGSGTPAFRMLGTGTFALTGSLVPDNFVFLGGSNGPLLRNNAGVIEARNNANNGFADLVANSISVTNPNVGTSVNPVNSDVIFTSFGRTFQLGRIRGRSYAANFAHGDLVLSANPAIATLGGSNLTDDLVIRGNTGNVEINRGNLVFGASGPRLRNNAGTIEARNNANTAAANINVNQVAATELLSNVIRRTTSNVTLTLGAANVTTAIHSVSIGGSGVTANSSGVSGFLRIDAAHLQTGTAGSTDLLINRTESSLGSGVHNFIDCQVGGVSRFGVSNTGNLTITGRVIQVPPSSTTLATNGQFSIEMTSNTAGNLVYRGSDGTTRRMALTFI